MVGHSPILSRQPASANRNVARASTPRGVAAISRGLSEATSPVLRALIFISTPAGSQHHSPATRPEPNANADRQKNERQKYLLDICPDLYPFRHDHGASQPGAVHRWHLRRC